MVGVELEVMAKKMDRFGWESDRGSMAHDRIMTDWMDALQNFPLDEVKAACRKWVASNPRKMPNEGDICKIISAQRLEVVRSRPAQPEPDRDPPVTKEQAAQILKDLNVRVNKFGGIDRL